MSDLSDELVRRFERQRELIVSDLRRTADKIERVEVRTSLSSLVLDYPDAAESIIHTVMWMVPNLRIEELVTAAALIDRELQKEADDA